ncbi:MAG: pseudouridine synthase [Synechococcus sp.]|jgi:23S rRNA pseudouridine2457 synthase|nr:pseudouridine synthase [Synechococcus sp. Tobar2m-G35]
MDGSAPATLLLHKPYGVLSQFTPEAGSRWGTLAPLVPVPGVYAAGRLDADSEGLLLLTADGALQRRLTDPRFGHPRRYHVQVEGEPTASALQQLAEGLMLRDGPTRPALVRRLETDAVPWPPREPPIRSRATVPTTWLELELREGRNRQVRRMTAAVGCPTLRLLRVAIDLLDGGPPLDLTDLEPGVWRRVSSAEQQRLDRLGVGGGRLSRGSAPGCPPRRGRKGPSHRR